MSAKSTEMACATRSNGSQNLHGIHTLRSICCANYWQVGQHTGISQIGSGNCENPETSIKYRLPTSRRYCVTYIVMFNSVCGILLHRIWSWQENRYTRDCLTVPETKTLNWKKRGDGFCMRLNRWHIQCSIDDRSEPNVIGAGINECVIYA